MADTQEPVGKKAQANGIPAPKLDLPVRTLVRAHRVERAEEVTVT